MDSTAVKPLTRSVASWPERLARVSASFALLGVLGCAGDDGGATAATLTDGALTESAPGSTSAGDTVADDSNSTGTSPGSGSVDDSTGNVSGQSTSNEPDEPVVCDAPEVACGNLCTNLDSDPTNCGLCGRTCIIANAEAGCAAGECTLLACDEGFSDCDTLLATGCEAPVECGGGPCQTECGSTGALVCNAACESECVIPAETCNAVDDDCNGSCDEGAMEGCRIGVHRSFSPTLGHVYTTDLAEAMGGDLNLEAQNFYFLYQQEAVGLEALLRCVKGNGRPLYTTAADCEGLGAVQETVGYIATEAQCGAGALYRVWNPASDSHFYTTSATERDNATANLGFQDQGTAGYVWTGL